MLFRKLLLDIGRYGPSYCSFYICFVCNVFLIHGAFYVYIAQYCNVGFAWCGIPMVAASFVIVLYEISWTPENGIYTVVTIWDHKTTNSLHLTVCDLVYIMTQNTIPRRIVSIVLLVNHVNLPPEEFIRDEDSYIASQLGLTNAHPASLVIPEGHFFYDRYVINICMMYGSVGIDMNIYID